MSDTEDVRAISERELDEIRCANEEGPDESWAPPIIRRETVEIDGVGYLRCTRALGIVRCTGGLTVPGVTDCGSRR